MACQFLQEGAHTSRPFTPSVYVPLEKHLSSFKLSKDLPFPRCRSASRQSALAVFAIHSWSLPFYTSSRCRVSGHGQWLEELFFSPGSMLVARAGKTSSNEFAATWIRGFTVLQRTYILAQSIP
eukprot:3700404-Amphidinium_carterae.1